MDSHETPCQELNDLKDDTEKTFDKIDKKLDNILSEMGCHKGKINTILQWQAPFWRNPNKVILDNPGVSGEGVLKDRIVNILLKTILGLVGIIFILLGVKQVGGL